MKALPTTRLVGPVPPLLFAVVTVALVMSPTMASAGDQEPVFFGGEASLTAGAVTAWTDRADAIWYNPAGLGLVQRNRISLSGSTFGVRIRRRPDMLQARLPNGDGEADSVSTADGRHMLFGFIPIGMGYAHSLNDRLAIGGLFFLRERDLFETSASLELEPGGEVLYPHGALSLEYNRWKMDFGLALGWQISSTLRLGVGFFATVFTRSTQAAITHDLNDDPATSAVEGLHLELFHKSTSIQGFATIGLQWDFAPRWHLGLVWRSSEAALWRRDTVSSIAAFEALTPLFGQETIVRVANGGDEVMGLASPMLFRLALAYTGGRGWIGLEGDVIVRRRDGARGYDEPATWNVRLGGRFALTERFSAGGGFFTANSSLTSPDGLVNPAVDTYGVTIGMQFRATHQVQGRDEPLVFITTMAGRYALAAGEIQGLLYDPTSTALAYEPGHVSDVFFYDLSWYFGTTMLF